MIFKIRVPSFPSFFCQKFSPSKVRSTHTKIYIANKFIYVVMPILQHRARVRWASVRSTRHFRPWPESGSETEFYRTYLFYLTGKLWRTQFSGVTISSGNVNALHGQIYRIINKQLLPKLLLTSQNDCLFSKKNFFFIFLFKTKKKQTNKQLL